jgi:uncharacterized damage-inducible protein DinB
MTASSDPIIASAREIFETVLADMRPAVEGASPEAVNWRPSAAGTNSIAVLAVHVMNSTRWWLSVATGAPLPDRDRESEFVAEVADADALLSIVDDLARDCETLLDSAGQVDWRAKHRTSTRGRPDASDEVTAAFALIHAFGHLHEHIGQMMLTRQLWDARNGS